MADDSFLSLLRGAFSAGELEDLCFELGVEYEDLGGEGKAAKARELIEHLQRRGTLPRLVSLCERERPHLGWAAAAAGMPQGDREGAAAASSAAAKRQRDERLYTELLAPMVMQLDRSLEAIKRWRKQNLFLEAEVVRKANLSIRDLLIEKASLIPHDLQPSASALVHHYDRWLEKYAELREGANPRLEEPFVFVGPDGVPFPRQAEAAFRARHAALGNALYGATQDE